MKWIKYSRYTGEDFGVDADDLLKALSDFLLQSGFNNQYMPGGEWDEHTLENLKQAIQQALESGKLFNEDALQEMMERLKNLSPEQMEQLLDNLIQKSTGKFELDCAPGLPPVRGNPQRIEQVVVNLLVNACQALPDQSLPSAPTISTSMSATSTPSSKR